MELEKLVKELEKDKKKMIKIRRYLHENPEISFKETKTAEYISKYYKNKGVEVKTHVGGNGVVVIIDSGKPGKTMGLRADFDALPIKEETGLAFFIKKHRSHARLWAWCTYCLSYGISWYFDKI